MLETLTSAAPQRGVLGLHHVPLHKHFPVPFWAELVTATCLGGLGRAASTAPAAAEVVRCRLSLGGAAARGDFSTTFLEPRPLGQTFPSVVLGQAGDCIVSRRSSSSCYERASRSRRRVLETLTSAAQQRGALHPLTLGRATRFYRVVRRNSCHHSRHHRWPVDSGPVFLASSQVLFNFKAQKGSADSNPKVQSAQKCNIASVSNTSTDTIAHGRRKRRRNTTDFFSTTFSRFTRFPSH